jgi:hypothetical protein
MEILEGYVPPRRDSAAEVILEFVNSLTISEKLEENLCTAALDKNRRGILIRAFV